MKLAATLFLGTVLTLASSAAFSDDTKNESAPSQKETASFPRMPLPRTSPPTRPLVTEGAKSPERQQEISLQVKGLLDDVASYLSEADKAAMSWFYNPQSRILWPFAADADVPGRDEKAMIELTEKVSELYARGKKHYADLTQLANALYVELDERGQYALLRENIDRVWVGPLYRYGRAARQQAHYRDTLKPHLLEFQTELRGDQKSPELSEALALRAVSVEGEIEALELPSIENELHLNGLRALSETGEWKTSGKATDVKALWEAAKKLHSVLYGKPSPGRAATGIAHLAEMGKHRLKGSEGISGTP